MDFFDVLNDEEILGDDHPNSHGEYAHMEWSFTVIDICHNRCPLYGNECKDYTDKLMRDTYPENIFHCNLFSFLTHGRYDK